MIGYKYADGGRSKYFKGESGDCVTRALAIALDIDYKEVYKELFDIAKNYQVRGKRESVKLKRLN